MDKRIKRIDRNDALIGPTLIDKIAGESLQRMQKEVNYSPITFATVRGGEKGQNCKHQGLLVPLDTGCSHSMLSSAMAKNVQWTRSNASFTTAAGQYETTHKAKVLFTLPEFSESKILRWDFHLDCQKDSKGTGYDMIIGRDLMQQLGLCIDFKSRTVTWEGTHIGMRDFFQDPKRYRRVAHDVAAIYRTKLSQGSDEPCCLYP